MALIAGDLNIGALRWVASSLYTMVASIPHEIALGTCMCHVGCKGIPHNMWYAFWPSSVILTMWYAFSKLQIASI